MVIDGAGTRAPKVGPKQSVAPPRLSVFRKLGDCRALWKITRNRGCRLAGNPARSWHVRDACVGAGNRGATAGQRGRTRRPSSARRRVHSVPVAVRGALQRDGARRSARRRGISHGLRDKERDAEHGNPRRNRLSPRAQHGTAKNVDEVRRLPRPERVRAVRGETHRDWARCHRAMDRDHASRAAAVLDPQVLRPCLGSGSHRTAGIRDAPRARRTRGSHRLRNDLAAAAIRRPRRRSPWCRRWRRSKSQQDHSHSRSDLGPAVDGGHTHGRRCRREVAGLAIMNYP